MSVLKLINEDLLKKQADRATRERSGKFTASQLGRCLRSQIYNRANIPPSNPPDERGLRIFAVGQLFHDFVQSYIPDTQKEILCETDDFIGYADVVTLDCIYDIKSQHSKGFFWMAKPTYDIKKEKRHNWLQVAYYGWVLGIPKICLMFISKDDLCVNEYFDYVEKWLPDLQEEMDILSFCWKEYEEQKLLPKGEPVFNNEGKYCSFRNTCKAAYIATGEDIKNHPCHKEKKK